MTMLSSGLYYCVQLSAILGPVHTCDDDQKGIKFVYAVADSETDPYVV